MRRVRHRTYLEYLKKILLGIQALRIAASAPNLEEFDLAELIAEVAAAEVPADKATVSLLGHQPMVCKRRGSLAFGARQWISQCG